MSKTMVLRPRISEKAYGLSQQHNTYVFDVPTGANRLSVASAIHAQFDVVVEDVRIANAKGKVKLAYSKRRRPVSGRRNDVKRAFVRLKAGDKLPIFAAEEAEEAKAKKDAEKATKKEKK